MYRRLHADNFSDLENTSPINYRGLSLARLFGLAGPCWKGGEQGIGAPHTWERLLETYQMYGMVEPEKWLMCTGPSDKQHSPVVFKLTSDLTTCLMEDYGQEKTKMQLFSYLPLEEVMKTFFERNRGCHDLLEMWHHEPQWIQGEDSMSDSIKEFWDGSKLQDYSALIFVIQMPPCNYLSFVQMLFAKGLIGYGQFLKN